MAVDIDSLQIEIEATSSDAASKIEQLATALSNLKSAAKGGAGLTTTTKQLQALSNAAKLINRTNINSKRIQRFAAAMNRLSNIQKASGLSSTINALRKLPDISSSLEKSDLGKFATQMNQVANAVRPLATEMQKVSNGFSAFPVRIQRIIQSNSSLVSSNNAASKSFGVLGTGIRYSFARFGIYTVAIKRIASVMSNWVQESNDYVENLNLFTVAMGEYAEEAKAYAEEVQEVMGIDSSEWMRNQGIFMQMATGFGVASDSAALMSKNLTQLGYDISSFYNISIEDAMQKLQSGIAGEIEPLRRLGYAIDVATLQQVAYEHGIQKSVNTMSQAEKSQLRYVAIMEQSGNVMQDLSRTLQTPANAMRILNQQITQLSRALGNLLIPFLQIVIPYVQAFVVVLTEAIQAIANLVGFTLPEIDYSGLDGVTSGATDAEEALGGAAAAAEDLKKATLGIDELNVISPIDAGGAGGGVDVGGGDLGLELPEYDFLGEFSGTIDTIKDKISDFIKAVSNSAPVRALGDALEFLWDKAIKPLGTWLLANPETLLKIAVFLGEIWAVRKVVNVVQSLGSNTGLVAIAKALKKFPAVTAIVGIAAALGVLYTALEMYRYNMALDEIERRFGNISLTLEESAEIAKQLLDDGTFDALREGLSLFDDLTGINESIQDSVGEVNKLNWKIQIGLEIDEEDQENYKSAVNSFVSNVQDYVDQYGYAVNVTINGLYSATGMDASEITSTVNTIIATTSGYMTDLGTELQEYVNEAFSDGLLTIDEQQVVSDLMNQMLEIKNILSEGQFEGKLNNIKMQYSGVELTYDSYQQLTEDVDDLLAEQESIMQEAADQTTISLTTLLKIAEYNLSKDPDDPALQKAVDDIKNQLNEHMESQGGIELELHLKEVSAKQFELNTVLDAFDEEITKLVPEMNRVVGEALTEAMTSDAIWEYYSDGSKQINLSKFWQVFDEYIAENAPELDSKTRAAILEFILPTIDELTLAAEQWRADGMQVPAEYAEGIKDLTALATLADTASTYMYGTIANVLSDTSPEGVAFFKQLYDDGYHMPEELMNGFMANENQKMFESTGLVAADKIGTGMLKSSSVKDYVKKTNDDLLGIKTEYEIKFTANVAAVQGALAGLLPSIRSTTYPNGYATGGFPESGQLFFANEGSAPELIGNMGRRTAVANTSQIVEGITYGVENANAQQNALLREQNDLLRAILAKSGTVRIGNKDIKNAYDTASRQSGATILSGGVV